MTDTTLLELNRFIFRPSYEILNIHAKLGSMKFRNVYPRFAFVSGSMGKYKKSKVPKKPLWLISVSSMRCVYLFGKLRIMTVVVLAHSGGGAEFPFGGIKVIPAPSASDGNPPSIDMGGAPPIRIANMSSGDCPS